MLNPLPSVLFGGPPHAGKSVLVHSLTSALNRRNIRHHVMRACPDGEGNWTQESDPHIVTQVRKHDEKGWPPTFATRIAHDLEYRRLPFLVDMGGIPTPGDIPILRQGTHSVLLLREDKPEATQQWREVMREHDLLPLAELLSRQDELSVLTGDTPFITGTINHLERGRDIYATGPAFDALVERIAILFQSFNPDQLEQESLAQAPTEPLNLYQFVPRNEEWTPSMLPSFLTGLPAHTSFSVSGRAPNWVYAALAAFYSNQPFYQFSARTSKPILDLPFSWVQPIPVQLNDKRHEDIDIQLNIEHSAFTKLIVAFPSKYLDYIQPEPLPFPVVRTDIGLVLDGPLPQWLVTALVRLYKSAGLPWIGVTEVRSNEAIVVYSHTETYIVGDCVPLS